MSSLRAKLHKVSFLLSGRRRCLACSFGSYTGTIESIKAYAASNGTYVVQLATREAEEEPEGPSSR